MSRTPHTASTLLALCLAAVSCGCKKSGPVKLTWTSMGTVASVSVPGSERDELTTVATPVQSAFDEINAQASLYRSNSVLNRIGASAGIAAEPVPDLTREVIAAALHYARLSDSRFDPTVAPIVRRWGFSGGKTPAQLPSPTEIAALMSLVGYQRVMLTNSTVYLPAPQMLLDLGGIAKGFAVDVAYRRLEAAGVRNALIDLGGNMRCLGAPRRDATSCWRIGVRNPFNRDTILGVIRLQPGMAVASSGNYEKFIEIDGVRYTHIIDPRTGMPVKGMAGTTVTCSSATETDALSTALFVAGVKEAAALLQKFPGCEALLVPDERPIRLLVTPGFKALFEPLPEFAQSVTEL